MPFSEDDLRQALQRKDPGPGFTQRVMARIVQTKETNSRTEQRKRLTWRGWTWKLRPALIGALAAVLLMIGGGLGYQEYERMQEKRLEAQKLEDKRAREAEQKVILALRITNAKLNHIFKRVNESAAPGPKIRRQSL